MNVSQIIARARRQCNTDEYQYTDTAGVDDINFIYQDLCNSIVIDVAEDFFWTFIKTNTIALQNEYDISKLIYSTSPDVYVDVKKVQGVGIKYIADQQYYTKAKFTDFNLLEKHRDYYNDTISKENPIFAIKDKSIFIIPKIDESIEQGLELECIYTPLDLTISSTTEDIKIPREFHIVLGLGIEQFIYRNLQKVNEANDSMNRYNFEKNKVIQFLQGRYQGIIEEQEPCLLHLQ